MSRVKHKQLAKEQLSESLVVAGVVFSIPLALFIFTTLLELLNLNVMTVIVGLGLLEYVLAPVVATVGMKYVRKEDFVPKDVMYHEVDTKLSKYAPTMLLTYLYTFLWALLLVIPGIIKAYAYLLVPYLISENPELSSSEAITKSMELMDGRKAEFFILDLSFFWWYLLVGVTFGIANVYVIPYTQTTRIRMILEILDSESYDVNEEDDSKEEQEDVKTVEVSEYSADDDSTDDDVDVVNVEE